MTSRPIALITGASSGIGAEFARQLAADGYDLVLVARDRARLDALAAEFLRTHGTSTEVISVDLGTPDGIDLVELRAAASARPVDMLVNNAGFGLREPFDENDVDLEQAMLDLLVAVTMRLTHAALQQMLPRRSGAIVNVGSVAGFTPGGTYNSAKAWVMNFSQGAHSRYSSRGVTVTVVAPGLVRTEFHQRMAEPMAAAPKMLWLTTTQVVRAALADVARGRAVSVPSLRYKLVVAVLRVLPWRVAARILSRR